MLPKEDWPLEKIKTAKTKLFALLIDLRDDLRFSVICIKISVSSTAADSRCYGLVYLEF